MLPRKFFENLRTVMGVSVVFEQLVTQILSFNLPCAPNWSITKYVAFYSHKHLWFMRGYGVSIIVKSKKLKTVETFFSSKTLLKLAGKEMHPPWIRACSQLC